MTEVVGFGLRSLAFKATHQINISPPTSFSLPILNRLLYMNFLRHG